MYQVRILNKERTLQAVLEVENWRYTKQRNQASPITVTIPQDRLQTTIPEENELYAMMSASQAIIYGASSGIEIDVNKLKYANIAYFLQIYKDNDLKASGKIIKRDIGENTVTIDAMSEEILLERSFCPAQYGRVFEGIDFADGVDTIIDNWDIKRISARSQWAENIDSENVSINTEPGQVHLDRDYDNEISVQGELLFNYTGGFTFGRNRDRLQFRPGEGNTIVINTVETPIVPDSWVINNLPDNFADVTITNKEVTDHDSGEITITYDNTGSSNFRPQVTIDYNYFSGQYFDSGYIVMRFEKENISNFKNWERIRWVADNEEPVFTTMQYRHGEIGNLTDYSEEFEGIAPDELGVIPETVDDDILDVKINLRTDDTTSEGPEGRPTGVTPRLFALEVIARSDSGIVAGNVPDVTGINLYDIDADNDNKLSILVDMCEQAGYDFELLAGELNVAESLGEDRTNDLVLRNGTNINIDTLSDDDEELVNVLIAQGDGDGINRPQITVRAEDSIDEYGEYTGIQEFNDVTEISELEEKANNFLELSKTPTQQFRINAFFEDEPEYEYGDTVRVVEPRTGIITKAVIDRETRSFDSSGLNVRLDLNKPTKRLIDNIIEPKIPQKKVVPRPELSVKPKIQGVIIKAKFDKFSDWERTEYHVSPNANFLPSSATLRENIKSKEVEITDLIAGKRYYIKAINYNQEGESSITSRESSVVTKGETISSTLSIAASNSSAKAKAGADYVCTGESDQEVINEAIQQLLALYPSDNLFPSNETFPSIGVGGKISLLEGTFFIDDSIIWKSNINIQGLGNTKIKIDNGINNDITIIKGNSVNNSKIFDIIFDGNSDNQESGYRFGIVVKNSENVTVRNCIFKNFELSQTSDLEGIAVHYSEDTLDCEVDGCIFDKVGRAVLMTKDTSVTNSKIKNSHFGVGSSEPAINCLIANNIFKNCAESAIILENAEDTNVIGNLVRDSGASGIEIINSEKISVDENICIKNGAVGVIGTGIGFINTSNSSIRNNKCQENGIGIFLIQNINNIFITNNDCFNNNEAGISDPEPENNIYGAGNILNDGSFDTGQDFF